jgi:hypothetical protein
MPMTPDEQLNLKKMMGEMDYQDNTDNIRRLKHSKYIREDVKKMDELRVTHADMKHTHPEGYFNIMRDECRFMYDNYTDLFNRLMKDELNTTILTKFLIVLKLIEDGSVDQQEGSVMIGKYLKDLYLDSAVRKADALDQERTGEKEPVNEGSDVSWKTYKMGRK